MHFAIFMAIMKNLLGIFFSLCHAPCKTRHIHTYECPLLLRQAECDDDAMILITIVPTWRNEESFCDFNNNFLSTIDQGMNI